MMVNSQPFRFVPASNWRPRGDLSLSLTGQNLLHPGHREVTGAEVPRSVFAQTTFDFGR